VLRIPIVLAVISRNNVGTNNNLDALVWPRTAIRRPRCGSV